MQKILSKNDFELAEKQMNDLLATATIKGGFDFLTESETEALDQFTQVVKRYEEAHFIIETPQTVQELIAMKMFEKNLKQKEIAKLLDTTDTKLSEIMHHKRKPSISFLKALNQVLEIDGNLLLRIV
ncbi:helix-turn-helix domain-containing protein [Flavobacterium sp.]|uniref:helix-turn-helix domain-containing protein n=1 Tax=Flavobacterium sp. TaxID=239 RepID=UPI00286E1FC8|nr:helix-turn-helix domain-containing protein [Flavobacterium sp.]